VPQVRGGQCWGMIAMTHKLTFRCLVITVRTLEMTSAKIVMCLLLLTTEAAIPLAALNCKYVRGALPYLCCSLSLDHTS